MAITTANLKRRQARLRADGFAIQRLQSPAIREAATRVYSREFRETERELGRRYRKRGKIWFGDRP